MDPEGESRRRTTSFMDPAAALAEEGRDRSLSGAMQGMSVAGWSLSCTCLLVLADSAQTTVRATFGNISKACEKDITFSNLGVVGKGSFGVVFKTSIVDDQSERVVALKKVLQDRRYKNRELEIMRTVSHCNIIELHWFFFTTGSRDDQYLNLVMEFLPQSLSSFIDRYAQSRSPIPMLYVKLSSYQMLRALAYLHGKQICHRDIKPQNLLLNAQLGILKLCDFGCAKVLVPDQGNVSYICSRYYRAPELCYGAQMYSHSIDVWSAACVLAEMLMCQPIFRGSTSDDQLAKIIKILGSPTAKQIQEMNPGYRGPQPRPSPARPLEELFKTRSADDRQLIVNLLTKMFDYNPANRPVCIEACADVFFDELRNPGLTLPDSRPLPALFNFYPEELALKPSIADKLKVRAS